MSKHFKNYLELHNTVYQIINENWDLDIIDHNKIWSMVNTGLAVVFDKEYPYHPLRMNLASEKKLPKLLVEECIIHGIILPYPTIKKDEYIFQLEFTTTRTKFLSILVGEDDPRGCIPLVRAKKTSKRLTI